MYYKKMSDMEVQILREGLELFIQKKENMKAGDDTPQDTREHLKAIKLQKKLVHVYHLDRGNK